MCGAGADRVVAGRRTRWLAAARRLSADRRGAGRRAPWAPACSPPDASRGSFAGTALLGIGLVVLGFRSGGSPPEPGTVVDVGEPSSPVVHAPVPDEGEHSRRNRGSRTSSPARSCPSGPSVRHDPPPGHRLAAGASRSRHLGAMEVPDDPADAGWYRLGPPPGALGPAVIAGHVTWNQVPAVFFRLSELRPGDLVEVTRADGRVAVFEVTASASTTSRSSRASGLRPRRPRRASADHLRRRVRRLRPSVPRQRRGVRAALVVARDVTGGGRRQTTSSVRPAT